jgi:hypothetical protein
MTIELFGHTPPVGLTPKEGCISRKEPHTCCKKRWWIVMYYRVVFLPLVLWPLIKSYGIMDSTEYQDILAKDLVAYARRLKLGHKWIFQQDNDAKHTSK